MKNNFYEVMQHQDESISFVLNKVAVVFTLADLHNPEWPKTRRGLLEHATQLYAMSLDRIEEDYGE